MNTIDLPSAIASGGVATTEIVIPTNQHWNIYGITIESTSLTSGLGKFYINNSLQCISYSSNLDHASGTPITNIGPGSKLKMVWSGLDTSGNILCNCSLLIDRIIK